MDTMTNKTVANGGRIRTLPSLTIERYGLIRLTTYSPERI